MMKLNEFLLNGEYQENTEIIYLQVPNQDVLF